MVDNMEICYIGRGHNVAHQNMIILIYKFIFHLYKFIVYDKSYL